MKYIYILLCALLAVVCVSGDGIEDLIKKQCPPGERSVYHCPRMAEPDCEIPHIHDFRDLMLRPCLEADCFCEPPTIRDRSTGQCVQQGKCPKNEPE